MEENKEKNPASPAAPKRTGVETYVDDMTKVIQGGDKGIIKKIIQAQNKEEEEREKLSPQSKRNKLFLVLSTILIVSAILVIVIFGVIGRKKSITEVPPQFVPIIYTDGAKVEDVSSLPAAGIENLVLSDTKGTKVKDGGVEGVYLSENKQAIGLRRFIALTGMSLLPGDPALVYDNFLIGAYKPPANSDTSALGEFFMLLKGDAFVDLYQPVRAWEPKMFDDLRGFMGLSDDSYDYLSSKEFADGVIENKNARILYDSDGNPVLMYIFADNSSVIIAGGEDAAEEILLRLSAGQIKK